MKLAVCSEQLWFLKFFELVILSMLICQFVATLKDRQKLLQSWVLEGENRSQCESRVVVSREKSNLYRGQDELLSIKSMIEDKKWPMEKIRGIISRSKGIPDPDCPSSPLMVQFWVTTSRTRTNEEATRQRSETEIQAETTPEDLQAMMQEPLGPTGTSTVTPDQLAAIATSTLDPTAGTLAVPGMVLPGLQALQGLAAIFCSI